MLGVSYWCQISAILDSVYSLEIFKYIPLLSILKSIVPGVLQENYQGGFKFFSQRGLTLLAPGGGTKCPQPFDIAIAIFF